MSRPQTMNPAKSNPTKHKIILLCGFFIAGLISYGIADGCPCGCGSAGPLILSQGESWKFQIGARREFYQAFVMQNGRTGTDDGPDFTDSLLFGAAYALFDELTVSLQTPFQRNSHRDGGEDYSIGDPTVGARYSLYQPGSLEFYDPLIQMHAAYKHSVARGVTEKSEKPHNLDIHGNGVSELSSGVDFWFNHGPWTCGTGLQMIWKRSLRQDFGEYSRLMTYGLTDREKVSLAYTFFGTGQIQIHLERESKQADRTDGLRIEDSDRLKHTTGISVNIRADYLQTVNITGSVSGYQFQNKNTPQLFSLETSFIRII